MLFGSKCGGNELFGFNFIECVIWVCLSVFEVVVFNVVVLVFFVRNVLGFNKEVLILIVSFLLMFVVWLIFLKFYEFCLLVK